MSREEKIILVVDDDAAMRRILVMSLKSEGYQVVEALGGEAALRILGGVKVDLVLSDLQMPAGDGFFLIKAIQGMAEGSPPVILITGWSDLVEAEAIEKGARVVLRKPFDLKHLVSEIDRVMGEQ